MRKGPWDPRLSHLITPRRLHANREGFGAFGDPMLMLSLLELLGLTGGTVHI
jgi:hypothetical protein